MKISQYFKIYRQIYAVIGRTEPYMLSKELEKNLPTLYNA